MSIKILAAVVALNSVLILILFAKEYDDPKIRNDPSGGARSVSITNLIVNPTLYSGIKISVNGYFYNFGNSLYLGLHEDVELMHDFASSVIVHLKDFTHNLDEYPNLQDCLNEYVNMIGIFDLFPNTSFHYIRDVEIVSTVYLEENSRELLYCYNTRD